MYFIFMIIRQYPDFKIINQSKAGLFKISHNFIPVKFQTNNEKS